VTRDQALARLRAQVEQGKPIIGAGAGTGLSAKCAEAGGVDLIIIYNSGRYRMAGRGSLAGLLPYGDANAIVVDMAREVLPIVRETPVLAGVCGTDPFRLMPVFLRELKEVGYVFDADQARRMAEAGADVLVPHMGLTTKGAIGAQTAKTLDESVELIQEMHDAAKAVNPDVLVLCHGGPIAEPEDAAYVLERTDGVVGFFGASSMERLPTEVAMTENMRRFKALAL
jgi:predicted TIM-barrel enzyme